MSAPFHAVSCSSMRPFPHHAARDRVRGAFSGDLFCRSACEGGQPFAAPRFAHLIPKSQRRALVGLNQRFLSAGTYFQAPDYGSDTVNRLGLERLRYAARLYSATATPILVSGGKPQEGTTSEAAQMKSVLVNDFKVPVTWEEPASHTTYESAMASRSTLKTAGINRIYLVTHAWHMRRAVLAFEAAGFAVIPAPTGFTTLPPDPPDLYLPNPQGLLESYIFMHEVCGWLWYKLKILVERVF